MSDVETISATSYTDLVNLVARKWESGLYDGTVTVYFEACIDPNGATRTTYAALYDAAGNQVEGSEISWYGGDGNVPTLVRSGAITLTNNTEYHVKAKRATGNGVLSGARLVIKQSGTITKTATYIDFVNNEISRAANSYTDHGVLNWPHDADLYDGITAAYFEASIRHSSGSYSAYAELWNSTDSSQVAEVSDASTTYIRKRSADIKASLADAKSYMPRFKNGGGNTAYCIGASLIIVQENFSKSASVLSVLDYRAGGWTGVTTVGYFNLTKADWSTKTITANAFFSGIASASGTGYGYSRFRETDGTNIDISPNITDTSAPFEKYDGAGGDLYSSLAADQDYSFTAIWSNSGEAYTMNLGPCGLILAFTLPTNTTLTGSDGTHALASDNINISVDVITLEVSEATHAHNTDGIDLVQLGAQFLEVEDALHALSNDAIVLIENITLAVNDGIHSLGNDSIELSPEIILSIEEATHSHTSEEKVLIQYSKPYLASYTTYSGTAGIVVYVPSDTQVGDLLLLIVETQRADDVVTPSGFTLAGHYESDTSLYHDTRMTVFYKVADETDAEGLIGYSIDDPGNHILANIISIRGCDTSYVGQDLSSYGGPSSSIFVGFSMRQSNLGLSTAYFNSVNIDHAGDLIILAINSGYNGTQTFADWAMAGAAVPYYDEITEYIDVATTLGDDGSTGVAYTYTKTSNVGATFSVSNTSTKTYVAATFSLAPIEYIPPLTIQDASHSHSADNISLDVGLVVHDTQHNHTSESAGVLEPYVEVQSATHSHSAEDVESMGEADGLLVAHGGHSLSSDNIDINVDIVVLSVDEGLHQINSDNIDVIENKILVMSEAAHAHSADSLTMQGVFLVVADCTHIISDTFTPQDVGKLTSISSTGRLDSTKSSTKLLSFHEETLNIMGSQDNLEAT